MVSRPRLGICGSAFGEGPGTGRATDVSLETCCGFRRTSGRAGQDRPWDARAALPKAGRTPANGSRIHIHTTVHGKVKKSGKVPEILTSGSSLKENRPRATK